MAKYCKSRRKAEGKDSKYDGQILQEQKQRTLNLMARYCKSRSKGLWIWLPDTVKGGWKEASSERNEPWAFHLPWTRPVKRFETLQIWGAFENQKSKSKYRSLADCALNTSRARSKNWRTYTSALPATHARNASARTTKLTVTATSTSRVASEVDRYYKAHSDCRIDFKSGKQGRQILQNQEKRRRSCKKESRAWPSKHLKRTHTHTEKMIE